MDRNGRRSDRFKQKLQDLQVVKSLTNLFSRSSSPLSNDDSFEGFENTNVTTSSPSDIGVSPIVSTSTTADVSVRPRQPPNPITSTPAEYTTNVTDPYRLPKPLSDRPPISKTSFVPTLPHSSYTNPTDSCTTTFTTTTNLRPTLHLPITATSSVSTTLTTDQQILSHPVSSHIPPILTHPTSQTQTSNNQTPTTSHPEQTPTIPHLQPATTLQPSTIPQPSYISHPSIYQNQSHRCHQ